MLRRIDASDRGGLLAREFPTVKLGSGPLGPLIEADAWCAAQSFQPFDEAVEQSDADGISVRGPPEVACEVLTRYQRFVERRNRGSLEPVFTVVLAAHRSLHDVQKPLVKADLDHALDTWQWMLRLDPVASTAVQLAALFHDVERLESEADVRIEHHAADYQAFKDAHALHGAERTFGILVAVGIERAIAERARDIVARHERRRGDREIDLLNDADALSFFSLNSSGYLDYFGPDQTRRKIRYTLGRLSKNARRKLEHVRLRPDVRRLFEEVA